MSRNNIKYLEAKLQRGIYRDTISVGFDVSVHSTGIALLKTTTKTIDVKELKVIKLPKLPKKATSKEQLRTINMFIERVNIIKNEFIEKYNIDRGRIEDCFFGRNVKTLKALARYGILAYDKFKPIIPDMDLLLPTKARNLVNFKKSKKKIKGYKLKKEIVEFVNKIFDLKLKAKDNDKADAIILALAGLCED